ncbi:MAG TPA: hypothetical protein VKR06_46260 [Ktedonosporobacter sp.]|nr:hypothetical protein [Ktedonosporobacter sp.]
MAVRSTMAALISRVRLLINDPLSTSMQFLDQDIQDVLDEGRSDIVNMPLIPKPTFTGSTIQYLNYYSQLGGWEDDYVLKQFLVTVVTPSAVEPIAGHFQFAATTLPPVYITGKLFDVYRTAADLLERWSARWVLSYSVTVDGQSLQRAQAATALQTLAKSYRMKQRAGVIAATRSDINVGQNAVSLAPTEIDFMGSGDGR